MGWRAEWLKRASPEEIASYRIKERERVRRWALDNPERVKGRKRDPEKRKVYAARWRTKNKGYRSANDLAKAAVNREETKRRRAEAKVVSYKRRLARNVAWAKKNKAKVDAYKASWHQANKTRLKQRAQARRAEICASNRHRRATDIQYAIIGRLRARIQKALRVCGVARSGRTADLIGCSVEQFHQHIERQFAKGMNWANRSEWHLDHIRPIASFDLTNLEQQQACFHFSNIRPLWRHENQRKSSRALLLL